MFAIFNKWLKKLSSSEVDEKMWRNLKTKMGKHNSRFGSREKRANEAQLKRAESHLAHLNNNKPHAISKKWETDWINTQNLINKLSLFNNKTKFYKSVQSGLLKAKNLISSFYPNIKIELIMAIYPSFWPEILFPRTQTAFQELSMISTHYYINLKTLQTSVMT